MKNTMSYWQMCPFPLLIMTVIHHIVFLFYFYVDQYCYANVDVTFTVSADWVPQLWPTVCVKSVSIQRFVNVIVAPPNSILQHFSNFSKKSAAQLCTVKE